MYDNKGSCFQAQKERSVGDAESLRESTARRFEDIIDTTRKGRFYNSWASNEDKLERDIEMKGCLLVYKYKYM